MGGGRAEEAATSNSSQRCGALCTRSFSKVNTNSGKLLLRSSVVTIFQNKKKEEKKNNEGRRKKTEKEKKKKKDISGDVTQEPGEKQSMFEETRTTGVVFQKLGREEGGGKR
eukprot:TRINITY_DN4517_c1_g1_i1.p2 TRINITY_DN4517_c1_g1~~TRINITY_DN4517_c1_g1_i1.p2  ORF type:complete len:112 (-),score=10.44 TRINITY_DN4517_c1_g1_i1:450-785(-)